MVIDVRTGEVLYSRNADTRLYPASLTKMMTLYVTFEAIKNGEITLDTKVLVSKRAAAEPPSKLGLRAGQKITVRNLIRAAAIKSANDAATALGEAVSGSEAAFARRMNRTAKALGMTRSTFKNAHGLTEAGHLSTARDMTTLGRHLFFDYPQYFNIFSRKKTNVAGREVRSTNRKFLAAYKGADGIKTGYTVAAGFNLVASARRGNKRIIAAVFGARSTAARNKKMAKLLDLGFKRAPSVVATIKPALPNYGPNYGGAKRVVVVTAVKKSLRPRPRVVRMAARTAGQEAEINNAIIASSAKPEAPVVFADTRPAPRADGLTVVTRVSTSGGRQWAISLGSFNTRNEAEKLLLRTALQDFSSLDGALRKVVSRRGGYQAIFVGLTEAMAWRACSRLNARRQNCDATGPSG
ncbi:MAG: D-alanyl-D-alanine carboxypeptidase [Alphaproteobacteria bacterium]|nr:D-alanyl-D-alanine carboxypeptidase [Alphaproteobacteria bacterium]